LKNQLPLDSSDYGFNVRPRWPLDAIDTSSKTT